jgi:NADPH:quinone reductase-like Zn-dependent oxidoreductase
MKAVFIREFGGLEKVQVGEVPTPEPGPGEVRIRVKAAALNHLDVWVRRGRPGASLEQAHVLGSDAAGTVEKTGPGVSGLSLGQEVVVNPGVSCQRCEWCLRGVQSECPQFKLFGFQIEGTCAEYLVAPAVNVAPKPSHLDWPEAAALNLAHVTAWRMLFSRADLKAGETVLIHGIGGGVALAALQYCGLVGATAIVTSSSDEKLKRAASLGAAHGINYKTADVAAEVRKLTGERGVDVALDSAGAATLDISMASVRRGGRIVTCGVTGGSKAEINLQQLYWNHISLLGSTMGSQEDFRRMLRLVTQAKLKPVMDRVFPLDQYRNAVERMESGAQFGKLALTV